jgi:fumarate hydratase subunit beta
MDRFTPQLLNAGLKAMIGKGERGRNVTESIVANRAVYLIAVGGAAVVSAQTVRTARVIAFEDLGPEAIYEMEVERFPVFVAIDTNGNDLFSEGVARYRRE